MKDSTLQIEINSLPKELRSQVSDFVAFLKEKYQRKSKLKAREFGYAHGKIKLSDDFDAPLEDFKDYQ